MNILQKHHYLVTIQTTSEDSVSPMGLFDGKFKFSTDRYDPVANGCAYEDESLVEGDWNTELLSKDGIKPFTQNINIIQGGNYAYASNLRFDVVNANSFHKFITSTENMYIIGREMILYTVIDNVAIQSWTGVVTGYNFKDDIFTIEGGDASNQDESFVELSRFGSTSETFTTVIEDEEPILNNLLVNRVLAIEGNVTCDGWGKNGRFSFSNRIRTADVTSVILDNYELYSGGSPWSQGYFPINDNNYLVCLNGKRTEIHSGMKLKFSGGDTYYNISRVTYERTGENTENYPSNDRMITKIEIDGKPKELIDFTQFYGMQNSDGFNSIIDQETDKLTDEKLLVSVYEKGLTFKPSEDSNLQFIKDKNGKYIAKDEDNNDILVNGVVNADGSLTITDYNVTTIKQPKKIKQWVDSTIDPLLDKIQEGTAKHLETYGSNAETPFIIPDSTKCLFVMAEFDEFVNNFDPYTTIDIMLNNAEVWSVEGTFGVVQIPYLHTSDTSIPDIDVSEFNYPHDTYWKTINAMCSGFEVIVYNIITDEYDGDMPISLGSFQLPNIREKWKDLIAEDGVIQELKSGTEITSNRGDTTIRTIRYTKRKHYVRSVPSTNLPHSVVKGKYDKVISTEHGLLNWKSIDDRQSMYPFGEWDLKSDVSLLEDSNKLLFAITPVNTIGGATGNALNWNFRVDDDTISKTYYGENPKAIIGIDDIGLFKTISIDSLDDIFFKTVNTDNDTFEKAIVTLSETEDTLPNRRLWNIGGKIEEDTSKFDLIAKLCQQGFIAGYTDRLGKSRFYDWLEDNIKPKVYHNNYNIVRNSLKAFKLSPLDQTYNEFIVKYQKFNGKFTEEMSINKIDQEDFPDSLEDEFVFDEPVNFSSSLNEFIVNEDNDIYRIAIDIFEETDIRNILDNNPDAVKFTNSNNTVVIKDPVYIGEDTTGKRRWDVTVIESDFEIIPDFNFFDINDYAIVDEEADIPEDEDWRTFVTGVDDYFLARDLWLQARSNYIYNQRVRKAPQNRTNLDFAIDLAKFYETDKEGEEAIEQEFTGQIIITKTTNGNYDMVSPLSLATFFSVNRYNQMTLLTTEGNFIFTNTRVYSVGTNVLNYRVDKGSSNIEFETEQPIEAYGLYLGVKLTDQEYDWKNGYAYNYLRLLVEWCTTQKFQANYSMAIEASTLKTDLCSPVEIDDPIITPDVGEVGKGWITSKQVNPSTGKIEFGVTFEPEFLSPPTPIVPTCTIIRESGNQDTVIQESGNNDTVIVEGNCN